MANEAQLAMLRQGAQAWNEWRRENHMRGMLLRMEATNLGRANLSGADLGEIDLRGARLSEANISGADLSEADLTGANLSRANLIGADLSRANLNGADLRGIDLRGAQLSEAKLRGADLSEANLTGANLDRANLKGADLFGANLSGANLIGADLHGADLSTANLSGAVLIGARLDGASLWDADLREADLTWADLHGADLHGANLSGADLRRANLRGANLRGADPSRANLRGTDLSGANLSESIDFYTVAIAEQREIEVEIALPQETINHSDLEQLRMAIDHLMEVYGFELKGELNPIQGSWWQTLIFWSKDKITHDSVKRRMEMIKELIVDHITGKTSAERITRSAEAIERVVKCFDQFDSGVIRIDNVLFIKDTQRGKHILRVETISDSLAQRLAANPQLIKMPGSLLSLIDEEQKRD